MSEMQQPRPTVPSWTLGWRLQRALDFANVKAGEMAEELEVTRSTISRWMHDAGAPPRTVYLKQWAQRCGVPYEWLRDGDAALDHSNGRRATDRQEGAHVDIGGYMGENGLPTSAPALFDRAA